MSCPKFIADSFAIRTATHLAHLSSTSYSEHVALGDFYDWFFFNDTASAESYSLSLPAALPISYRSSPLCGEGDHPAPSAGWWRGARHPQNPPPESVLL